MHYSSDTHRPMGRCKRAARAALVAFGILALAGCKTTEAPPPVATPHFPELPLADVAPFMQGTMFERVRFANTDPMTVYGYGLVVNLRETGDTSAPSFVRDYITKQMLLVGGFGTYMNKPYQEWTPERILHDKRVAIVTVEGDLPIGARQNQRFDLIVKAINGSSTTSLAHGQLYQTQLSVHGLVNPTGIRATALAEVLPGTIFVNPSYALGDVNNAAGERSSLRVGTVLNAGIVLHDRPINLQIRQPQISTARLIEQLMAKRFRAPAPTDIIAWEHDRSALVAVAESEGLVELYVPPEYKGDWKHFVGVVSHMYLNNSPQFVAAKARQLVQEAHKPDAPLVDISLCFEAMGESILPIVTPMINDSNPNVAFAAARAAAFLGDSGARHALLAMGGDPLNPNQLDAVRVLGQLPGTPETSHMLRTLLNASKADVRIEAYQDLIGTDQGILTEKIGDSFYLDIVESTGTPMVYATTTGVPRLAIFGNGLTLRTPITFLAMNQRFQISSSDGTRLVRMFYRDPSRSGVAIVDSHNDLPEILARMAGQGPDGEQALQFNFNEVVAIAKDLVESSRVYGTNLAGQQMACVFQTQHDSYAGDGWISYPDNPVAGRPQGGGGVITVAGANASVNGKAGAVDPSRPANKP